MTGRAEWPYTTPSGHTYDKPTTYAGVRQRGNDYGQGLIESWDEKELPPQPTWAMVGLIHRVAWAHGSNRCPRVGQPP